MTLKTLKLKTFYTALLGLWLLCNNQSSLAAPPAVILVIDDIGYDYQLGKRAIALPGAIHYAILPERKNSAKLAKLAYQQGKEVLLHAPMSTINGQSPGPLALTPALNRENFISTLNQQLASIPQALGVNNHMGSQLTQLNNPMSWLMSVLKKRQLYFLDSRTTAETVAQQHAQLAQLPNLKRDIFLDNSRKPADIRRQFEKLLSIADENGHAVAIGHPYPETLAVLEEYLPSLSLRGYQQRFASEFLQLNRNHCEKEILHRIIDSSCTPSLQQLALSNQLQ